MAEAPELEALLEVDQLLGSLVGLPVGFRRGVDAAERLDDAGGEHIGLRPVAFDDVGRHVVTRRATR